VSERKKKELRIREEGKIAHQSRLDRRTSKEEKRRKKERTQESGKSNTHNNLMLIAITRRHDLLVAVANLVYYTILHPSSS
jgi:hypothetical protein